MPAPRLVVGLGNPGAEYEDNRHNLGFWFVDQLARDLKIDLAPQGKFFGLVGRQDDLRLLEPTTYMNCSGRSVAALACFYRIFPDEILVAHDDLDLPPGSIRVKQGGGNGGHNGIKDIQASLGTPDFWRLRLGIGHPGDRDVVMKYVLKAPRGEEFPLIDHAIGRCLSVWSSFASGDYEAAKRALHTKAD
ncbi:MAG: aminoacyl-tRNA hydrolase [Candidatus Accumulibacter sp.]|jgi:PTH1 family peptidyl-tRNA hydrolase|nr:aminoacyl-tRNA hydrolase [Accumulibacter sp.]